MTGRTGTPALDWRSRTEFGNARAIRWGVRCILRFGRRFGHAAMVPVAAYYWVRRPAERRASKEFLARTLPHRPRQRDVFRHFLTFARVNVDRVFFLAERADRIHTQFHGREQLLESVTEGRGGLFLAAHFGSFEAARTVAASRRTVRVRIVIHRHLNAKLMSQLEALNPEFTDNLIDAAQSPAALGLEIAQAVDQGEWVGFLIDRAMPGARTEPAELLGEAVDFARGPFEIGAALKLPIYSIFSVYDSGNYEVYSHQISPKLDVKRADRERAIQQAVRRFAAQLDARVRAAPYNWFNFYDFWPSKSI